MITISLTLCFLQAFCSPLSAGSSTRQKMTILVVEADRRVNSAATRDCQLNRRSARAAARDLGRRKARLRRITCFQFRPTFPVVCQRRKCFDWPHPGRRRRRPILARFTLLSAACRYLLFDVLRASPYMLVTPATRALQRDE